MSYISNLYKTVSSYRFFHKTPPSKTQAKTSEIFTTRTQTPPTDWERRNSFNWTPADRNSFSEFVETNSDTDSDISVY